MVFFKKYSLFFLLIFTTLSINCQILIDDFNRVNNTVVGNGWTEVETASGAQIVSNYLQLGSTTAGREWVWKDATGNFTTNGITNNTTSLVWAFNMKNGRAAPSGFDAGNYGIGFVLGSTSSDYTLGNGYAIVLGNSSSPDPIRLVRFTGGLDLNSNVTNIITGGDYQTANTYFSIKVVYDPTIDNWSLYCESSTTAFPQANPVNTITQVGSSIANTTYTTTGNDLKYYGCFWNHSTAAIFSSFDDVYIPTITCSAPSTQASSITFSSVDYNSMTVSWTTGNGSKRVVLMNTSNSFTDPVNGTDPSANSVYGGSGQQVVYNSNGNSVGITGLTPGTTYWYRVYEYNCTGTSTVYNTSTATNNPNSQATLTCSSPTTQASSVTFSSVSSSSMTVNWTIGNGAKRIVIINTSNSFTDPTNGTDPAANSVYAGSGEQVVYNNSGNSVSVTGLSPSTTYWFRVYEYNCTGTNTVFNVSTATGNPNSQATIAGSVPATLTQGDLVVVGVCSNTYTSCAIGTSAGDDEISFMCFEDITTGTTIDMTDNGWQRVNANQWGSSEGTVRATRTGGTITKGTIITIRCQNDGTYYSVSPDAGWSFVRLNVVGADMILNSNGDQIYFMQGGTWTDGATITSHDALYTGGNILFAFNTYSTWNDFINSTQRSGLITGMDCFSMMPAGATDYLKYTGPSDPCTQIEWIGRINEPTNWTSYANCIDYYAGAPSYTVGYSYSITSTGIDVTYNWYGHKNTEWFDCANWGTLRIPTSSTNVVIPNSPEVENNIVLIAGQTAECRDFTISNPSYSIIGEGNSSKVLTVNRHLVINSGTIDFDDGNIATADGTINIASTWTNNSTTISFLRGNSTVNFTGTSTHIITSSSGVENFHNISIASPGILSPGANELWVSGTWTNYSSAGFSEGTGWVTFDGFALQSISTPGGETFYDLEIKNNANVSLGANVTVTNNLFLHIGNLEINGASLTLQNSLSYLAGFFTGSSTSDLIINGTGNLSNPLWFSPGGEFLDILSINRASSGIVTLGDNLTISGQLAMVSGILSINGRHLTINGTTSGTGTVSGSALSELTIGGSGAMGTIYFTSGADQVRNLTVNRTSGTAVLGTDLTVNNILTLTNGIISTGTFKLVVTNSAATAVAGYNTNSYINGNLRRYIASNTDTYGFPVGSATRYTLAELINGNLSGITYLDAKFLETFGNTGSLNTSIAIDNGTPYSTISTEGIWQIDPDLSPSGGDYDIKLWFNDGGGPNPFSGIADGQFGPLKRPSTSTLASDWAGESTGSLNTMGTAGTTLAGGYAQRNNITSFSHHAIGLSAFLLPIELVSFDAEYVNGKVFIDWITSSEVNNDYFTVEKSADGIVFEELAIIKGAGNSFERLFYSETDYHPFTGTTYYRLKQTDFDGKFSYSDVVAVNSPGQAIIDAFYSSSDNSIKLLTDDFSMYPEVKLTDITGKIIFIKKVGPSAEIGLADFNLASGIYFINIAVDKRYLAKKIFIP